MIYRLNINIFLNRIRRFIVSVYAYSVRIIGVLRTVFFEIFFFDFFFIIKV